MENNTDITLEGDTATWLMPQMNGELQGTYTGSFRFRTFLDPLRRLQAGREYRELLGPYPDLVSEADGHLAYALSQLKQRVISSPPFWTASVPESGIAGNIGDKNVILAVLDAAIRAEDKYKEKNNKERNLILDHAIKVGEELLQKQSGSEE